MKLYGNNSGSHSSSGKDREIKVQEIRVPEKESAAKAPAKKKKKKRGRRRALIVICAIVLAICAALAVYAIWERPPEVAAPPAANSNSSTVPNAPSNGDTPDNSGAAPEDDLEVLAPEIAFDSEHAEGVYTMLVVGRDYASNSTDTIMLARFDTVAHKIDVVNIPRDTMVNITWATTPKKINAVFPGYTNSGRDGLEGLRQHVQNLLGFDVDCYAVVTLRAVEDAVNAIGGIYFDVPQDMDYDDGEQYFHVHLKQGYQLLNGYETLGVFRYRHGYANGDLDRIQVQQNLLKAIASQMLSLGNIPNLSEVIKIVVDNVDTNLSAANIAWFLRQFLQCDMDSISFSTVPTASSCYIGGVSYVSIDVPAWIDMVNEKLNPYADPITQNNVNILTSNYSGSVITSTSGTIAGGYDSFYCQMCTSANGKASYHAPGACPANEPEATEPPVTETPAPETEQPSAEEPPVEEMPTPETPVIETPEIEVVYPEDTQSAA